MLQALPMVFVLVGLAMYTVLAGADFGAGFWQLVGGIATNRVPVGNASGNLVSSWLNPTSIFIGVLAVSSCAYLAAVYLAADAARDGDPVLEQDFRLRALGAGVVGGLVALAGILIVNA